jgi:AcrR family transcriptional regulator
MSKAKIATLASQQRPKLVGNVKVTRDEWLKTAMDVLVSQGVEQVKVQPIGERLGVSRSSFYWYFKSRQHLLDTLLDSWERSNTGAIITQCEVPAQTITEAVCNLFRCFVDSSIFDHRLDFAIREWSRRSGAVRRILDASDQKRLEAIAQIFVRHGYDDQDAKTRARIL